MKLRLLTFLCFLIGTGMGVAVLTASEKAAPEEKPPPELISLGRELFNHKERLGIKYACILCHQKDKAIKRSAVVKLGDRLPDVINLHIKEKAKGKSIPNDSQEMKALAAYIRHEHSV